MRIDIPSVCQASCAEHGRVAIGPHPDRRMRTLHWPCGEGDTWDCEETPLVFNLLLGPQTLEHGEHFDQPRHGIRLGHAKGLKFRLAIPQGGTERELPIADGIECPDILS